MPMAGRIGLWVAFAMALASGPAAAEILPLDVAKANITYSFPDNTMLDLELTPTGGEAFAAFTEKHVGETIDLKVDGKVVISPKLVEPITTGHISVSGKFAPGRLESIAKKISAGTATIDVETQN